MTSLIHSSNAKSSTPLLYRSLSNYSHYDSQNDTIPVDFSEHSSPQTNLPMSHSTLTTLSDNSYSEIPDSCIRDEQEQKNPYIPYSIHGHLKLPVSEHLRYEYFRNPQYYRFTPNPAVPTETTTAVDNEANIVAQSLTMGNTMNDSNTTTTTTPQQQQQQQLTSENLDALSDPLKQHGGIDDDKDDNDDEQSCLPSLHHRRLVVIEQEHLLKKRFAQWQQDEDYDKHGYVSSSTTNHNNNNNTSLTHNSTHQHTNGNNDDDDDENVNDDTTLNTTSIDSQSQLHSISNDMTNNHSTTTTATVASVVAINNDDTNSTSDDDQDSMNVTNHPLTLPFPKTDQKYLIFQESLPSPFLIELKTQLKLAGPLICSYTASYAVSMVNLAFQGHISEDALASSSIAIFFMNVTGSSILYGLNSAVDTLASQHFGRGNMFQVGMTILRSILVAFTALIFIATLWVFSATPLGFLLQDKNQVIVNMAQQYIRISIWALPAVCLNDTCRRYLEIQQITLPSLFINLLGLVFAIPSNYCLTVVFKFGFLGSAYNNILVQYCMLAASIIYLQYSGLLRHIPLPWQSHALVRLFQWQSLSQYMSFALPGVGSIAGEWIAFEVQTLIASIGGKLSVASQSLLLSICTVVFLPAMSIGISASVRAGAFLGAKQTACALNALNVSIFLGICCQLIIAGTLFFLNHLIIGLFTNQTDVKRIADNVVPFLSLFCLFDGFQGLLNSVMRGIGKQKIAFLINVGGYWMIALPLSWYLSSRFSHHTYIEEGETITRAGLGIIGQWYAMLVAAFLVFSSYILFLFNTSWTKRTIEIEKELNIDKQQELALTFATSTLTTATGGAMTSSDEFSATTTTTTSAIDGQYQQVHDNLLSHDSQHPSSDQIVTKQQQHGKFEYNAPYSQYSDNDDDVLIAPANMMPMATTQESVYIPQDDNNLYETNSFA